MVPYNRTHLFRRQITGNGLALMSDEDNVAGGRTSSRTAQPHEAGLLHACPRFWNANPGLCSKLLCTGSTWLRPSTSFPSSLLQSAVERDEANEFEQRV